jgi:hypothetical protein
VVADISGFDLAATRRLQLAAEAGRALALLTRSNREIKQLSAATTRWLVEPFVMPVDPRARASALNRHPIGCEQPREPGAGSSSYEQEPEPFASAHWQRIQSAGRWGPAWRVRLLRYKGHAGATEQSCHWLMRWDRAKGVVAIPANVVDRPGQASPAARDDRRQTA